MFKTEVYPTLSIDNNKKPNRLYAFPLFGVLIKFIILIPQFIELAFLGIIVEILLLINSFVVLFTGKYWEAAYARNLKYARFLTKVFIFFIGLSDSYPGFSLSTNGKFTLDIKKPQKPNRFFAFPILGGLVRIILLIPYFIYSQILSNGSWAGMVAASFSVLFRGKYPESLYEFERDSQRVFLASGVNLAGLSDKYPSFKISMSHKNVKYILIAAGIILFLFNNSHRFPPRP